MDKTTKWLIRISALVIIGAGSAYLFRPEIGSLNPDNRQREKTEIDALEKQAKELEKILADQKEALRFRKTIKCLNCLKPKYPKELLMSGITGSASIKVFINKDGTVRDAIVQNSSGYLSWDNAALDAARESTFNPIKRDGDILIKYDMKLGM